MANTTPTNVLVIGDFHAPFTHPDYLDFCKKIYKQYKCNRVVCIGDEIDNHFSSFHATDPDGYGAGEELKRAVDQLQLWHKAFPYTDVIIGNHTRIVTRKLYEAGVSSSWVKPFQEVLQVPTWKYHNKLIIDNVLYIHGEGVTARTKALRSGRSVVQGHRHTEAYVWYHSTGNQQIFGMQVGTGIENDCYAFAYAKDHPDPLLSCGVVVNGKQAHVISMI
jgi:metallophosphoesterase superfamily enzyme